MGFLSFIVGRFGQKFPQATEPKLKFGPKLTSEIPDRLGPQGERMAAEYLQRQGYQILEKNFRVKPGEIDLIARDGDTLCFVEVKARRGEDFGEGSEAIATLKKRKLCQAALMYMTRHKLTDAKARFDIVSIQMKRDGKAELELIKNAFEVHEGLF
jgi:putative endonuclease